MVSEHKRIRRRNPKFYTVAEVAERMSMHANSILWNIRQGYLKAEFDGYRYSIHPQDFREWRDLCYE